MSAIGENPNRQMTGELRALAVGEGADLIGVAPVERFIDVEPGCGPLEYMPKALTVLSVAVHIPHGVCDIWGQPGEPGRTPGPYLFYGYGVTCWEVSRISLLLARHLELSGYRSICFPPAWSASYYRNYHRKADGVLVQDFPHQVAAVAAGLGELGLAGLCLTPEFGARQRFGSVLTDAPLTPDTEYAGPPISQPDECGRHCVEVCPTGAFDPDNPNTVRVGEGEYPVAGLDGIRCQYGLEGLVAGTGGHTKETIPAGPGRWDDLSAAKSRRHPTDALLLSQSAGVLVGNFCERCLHQCPAKGVVAEQSK
jgi:epoxyqueuosine reductase